MRVHDITHCPRCDAPLGVSFNLVAGPCDTDGRVEISAVDVVGSPLCDCEERNDD
jgi:hypothetical protein